MAKKPKAATTPPEPDALVRQAAGRYRTGDDRFEVRQADVGWFLVDTTQTNDFGQELIRGPFDTLAAVRASIPDARQTRVAPARRSPRRAPKPTPPPPPPRSWLDDLPTAESRSVRRLIEALEREGIDDAEDLVRRDRDGLLPAVAGRLIERRLAAVIDDLPARERAAARRLVERVAEILSADGSRVREPLPGWELLETRPGEDARAGRRIDLRR
jgi:hypothetical protein